VTAPDARQYPDRPIVGVGAIVVDSGGRVLIVKRRNAPLAGHWSVPGGSVELGETLRAAIVREVREETGLEVSVGPLVDVLDRISLDPAGRIAYHYVLVDYLCAPAGGVLAADTDAVEAAFVTPGELADYGIATHTREVVERALTMRASGPTS
jgi:mutator protein MutT